MNMILNEKLFKRGEDQRNWETLMCSFTGRSIVREIQCAGGKDARRSECCCVMQQIGIQTLSHLKRSRRLARV